MTAPTLDLIPTDILAVAAIITGGESHPLTGWQRLNVIAAAHALGWRVERISAALCIPQHIHTYRLARDIGLSLAEADHEPDWTAIDIVCQGTAMRLTAAADRVEVVQRLADTKTTGQIAALIGAHRDVVSRIATELGVQTRPAQVRWHAPRQPAHV